MNVKIYKLTDPNTNEIMYIGKTEKELYERLAGHIGSISRIRKFSKTKDWLINLLKNNQIPKIELIDIVDDSIVDDKEKYYIQLYYKNGNPLLNIVHLNNEEYMKYRSDIKSKPIYQYDLNGNFIKEWKNLTLASKEYNLDIGNISASARGSRKLSGIFQWRYNKYDKIDKYKIDKLINKVHVYNLNGDFINSYDSVTESSLKLNLKARVIYKCCENKLKSYKNKRFSFTKFDKLPLLIRKSRKDKGIQKSKI